jgi:hypothetical protein
VLDAETRDTPQTGDGSMQHSRRWMVAAPLAALPLWACQPGANTEAYAPAAQVEHVDGTGLNRVTLTAKAAERLDIQTASVEAVDGPGSVTSAVPYGAVIYGAQGDTWVYTGIEDLTFVRHAVSIVSIEGDRAYLSDGPDVGTQVVSVGAAELLGTEFDVGR